MLFRQKEKILDVGKDNFREFYRRENESCITTQAKLMKPSMQQKMSQSQVLDGSLKMLGSTYDAQHLGTFLTKSKFASTGTRALRMTEPFEGSLKNQSFFFRNQQPRLIQENIDYLHLTKLNHIVAEHPVTENSEFLKKKLLLVPDKSFDEKKLNYQSEGVLKQPKEYLQDLQETRENQLKYKEWRSQYQDVNRAHRKAKVGFKSGLYGLDTPFQEGTELYKEEHELIKAQNEQHQKQQLHRFKSLEKYQASNPSVEFNNVLHTPNQPNHLDPILREGEFPHKNFEMRHDWMKKKGSIDYLEPHNRRVMQILREPCILEIKNQEAENTMLSALQNMNLINQIMLTDCQKFCKESLAELQAKLAHKEKKLLNYEKEKDIMLSRIEELYSRVNEQNDQLKSMRMKVAHYEKTSNKLLRDNKELNRERTILNETVQLSQSKREKFKRYERIIAELQGDVQKLANSLEEHKIVRQDNSEEMMRMELHIQQLEQQLQEQDQSYKYNNQMIVSNVEETYNQELQTQIQIKDVELKQLNHKLTALNQQYSQSLSKIVKACGGVYSQVLHLHPELEQTIAPIKFNKKDVDCNLIQIDFEIQELQAQELNAKLDELHIEKTQIEQKYSKTAHKSEALQMREQDLQLQIQRLQTQVDKLKELNNMRQRTMTDQIAGLQRTNKQLIADYSNAQTELEDLRCVKESLQQTIERQEKRIQAMQLGML